MHSYCALILAKRYGNHLKLSGWLRAIQTLCATCSNYISTGSTVATVPIPFWHTVVNLYNRCMY